MAIPFNINPAITPIPTAGAWIYNNISQQGTTSNSSTSVTALAVGTSFLQVGQPVSGQNIAPGTTIAAITGAQTITLNQNTLSSGGGTGTLTFGSAPNTGSAFSNDLGWATPLVTLTDVPGCDFAIPETQTIVAGASFVPAPGAGYISITNGATTGSTLQIQTGAGSWTTIFTATVSATTFFGGLLVCDGGNVRFTAAGATNPSFTFYRFRQMPVL